MKKIASLALATVLTATSLGAYAQGPGPGGDDRHDQQHQSQQQGRGHDKHQGKSQERRDEPRQEARQEGRRDDRGPDFRRGQRLDRQYRDNQYVVEDWRGHHLSRPPRGHHWVQVGDRYVLVAVATGIIASIILSH